MRYGVIGSSGRMGLELISAFGQAGHELALTCDIDGMNCSGEPQVLVDFSRPSALRGTLELCREKGCGLVLGTTGLEAGEMAELAALAESRSIVQSANFGEGMNLLAMLLREYGELFAGWTVEMTEAHHDRKVDAPSGSAIMLRDALGRDCPIHSLRMGNLPGDHIVHLAKGDELLTFHHHAINRGMFAQGALRAAEFVVHAEPGLYTFADVLRGRRQ